MSPVGRPQLPEPANLHSVYITERQVAIAKKVGEGNISAGVRKIIDSYEQREIKS